MTVGAWLSEVVLEVEAGREVLARGEDDEDDTEHGSSFSPPSTTGRSWPGCTAPSATGSS